MENNIINSFKTVSKVEEYRKSINEQCDERISIIERVKRAEELSNKSFGYIKECFEAISPVLFNLPNGKILINKYTNLVKDNKNLSSLHKIHEAIRKAGKDTDVDFLTKSLSETNWNIDKNTVNEDVKKLGTILAEAYITLGSETDEYLPKEDEKLYKAISYIAENKLSRNNLVEHSYAIKIIKESIANKETGENIFEEKDLDKLAKELLDEFNSKYSGNLSEDEIAVLKEIASNENREDVFNKYKDSCIVKITEARKKFDENGDEKSSERLKNIMEQVKGKNYCLETVGDDICNIIELSKIFD
jgi:hypothetical protein